MLRSRTIRLFAVLVVAGCAKFPAFQREVELDPDANFTAHREHRALVIDRLPDGGRAKAVPPGWFGFRKPNLILVIEGETRAAFWITAPARVEAHAGTARDSPSLADVVPDWDDGAIRLTLRSPEGEAFSTGHFERVGAGTPQTVLSRNAQTVLDVRGAYRAAIRDAKGGTAGWMRVRVSPYAEAPRIYDGNLPKAVGPALATATALALDNEIDWIEDHTLNVYRGKSGGGLEQSIPIGK